MTYPNTISSSLQSQLSSQDHINMVSLGLANTMTTSEQYLQAYNDILLSTAVTGDSTNGAATANLLSLLLPMSMNMLSNMNNFSNGNNNNTKSSLYKTELCKRFAEFGHCRYGIKCQFAHGDMELRHILRHPKYKTTKCKSFWGTGHCPYGIRCRFIHEENENSNTNAYYDNQLITANNSIPYSSIDAVSSYDFFHQQSYNMNDNISNFNNNIKGITGTTQRRSASFSAFSNSLTEFEHNINNLQHNDNSSASSILSYTSNKNSTHDGPEADISFDSTYSLTNSNQCEYNTCNKSLKQNNTRNSQEVDLELDDPFYQLKEKMDDLRVCDGYTPIKSESPHTNFTKQKEKLLKNNNQDICSDNHSTLKYLTINAGNDELDAPFEMNTRAKDIRSASWSHPEDYSVTNNNYNYCYTPVHLKNSLRLSVFEQFTGERQLC